LGTPTAFDRYYRYKRRIDAVYILKGLKEAGFTYREISRETGISMSLISNYINGKILPSIEKARQIIRMIQRDGIIIRVLCSKMFNIYSPNIATVLAWHIISRYCVGHVIQTVMAADKDSLVLASKIAEIINAPLICDSHIQRQRKNKRSRVLLVGVEPDGAPDTLLGNPRLKLVKAVFLRGDGNISSQKVVILCPNSLRESLANRRIQFNTLASLRRLNRYR